MPLPAKALTVIAVSATILALPQAAAASPQTVTFHGKALLKAGALSCTSEPDAAQITIKTGATIDFFNDLGRNAVLWVGTESLAVPENAYVPVRFRQPTSVVVQMVPDCTLDTATHYGIDVEVIDPPPPATAAGTAPTTAPVSEPTATQTKQAAAVAAGPHSPRQITVDQSVAQSVSMGAPTINTTATVGDGDMVWIGWALLGLAIIAVTGAIAAWINGALLRRMLRRGGSSPPGGSDEARLPPGQAAQIFYLARRIGRRDMQNGSQ